MGKGLPATQASLDHLPSECAKNCPGISWIRPALSDEVQLTQFSRPSLRISVIPRGASKLVPKSNCFCYMRSVYEFTCPCFHYYFNQNGKFGNYYFKIKSTELIKICGYNDDLHGGSNNICSALSLTSS